MIYLYHQIILYVLEENLLEYNKVMTTDDQIKDEKKYSMILTRTANISALLSDKINKNEHLSGKKNITF